MRMEIFGLLWEIRIKKKNYFMEAKTCSLKLRFLSFTHFTIYLHFHCIWIPSPMYWVHLWKKKKKVNTKNFSIKLSLNKSALNMRTRSKKQLPYAWLLKTILKQACDVLLSILMLFLFLLFLYTTPC